jgi:hypothetical protein
MINRQRYERDPKINAVLVFALATLKKLENSFALTISRKSKTRRKKLLKNHTTLVQQFSA